MSTKTTAKTRKVETLDGDKVIKWLEPRLDFDAGYAMTLVDARLKDLHDDEPEGGTYRVTEYDPDTRLFTAERKNTTRQFDLGALRYCEVTPPKNIEGQRLADDVMGRLAAGSETLQGRMVTDWVRQRISESGAASNPAGRLVGAKFFFKNEAKTSGDGETKFGNAWDIISFDTDEKKFVVAHNGTTRSVGASTMSDGWVGFPASKASLARVITRPSDASRKMKAQKAVSFDEWNDKKENMRDGNGDLIVADMLMNYDLLTYDDTATEGRFRNRNVGNAMPPSLMIRQKSLMANPSRTSRMSETEAAKSTHAHYSRVLAARDDNTEAVLNAFLRGAQSAAKTDIKEVRSTLADREHREARKEAVDATTELMNAGLSAEDASLEVGATAGRADFNNTAAKDAIKDIWVVAGSTDEAAAARAMMELAVEHMTLEPLAWETAEGDRLTARGRHGEYAIDPTSEGQCTLTRNGEMLWALPADSPEALRQMKTAANRDNRLPLPAEYEPKLDAVRPDLFEDAREPKIAVFSRWGAEQATVNQAVSAAGRKGTIFCPANNKNLVQAAETAVGRARLFTPYPKAKAMQQIREVLDKSDTMVIGLEARGPNATPADYLDDGYIARVVADASRRGKIHSIVDANGTTLDKTAIESYAVTSVPSWREEMLDKNAAAFDIPVNTPEARLGMQLLTLSSDGDEDAARHVSTADRDKIAAITITDKDKGHQRPALLSEVVSMAQDGTERFRLLRDHGVSAGGIRLLADKRSLSNARESTARTLYQCQRRGITLMTRESFPETLAQSPDCPDLLFVRAKNPEAFKSLDSAIAMFGDSEMLPGVAQRTADFAGRLSSEGVSPVFVERQGMPTPTADAFSGAPPVMFLKSAHGHPKPLGALAFKQEQAWSELQTVRDEDKRAYEIVHLPEEKALVARTAPAKDSGETAVEISRVGYDVTKDSITRQERRAVGEELKKAVNDYEAKALFGDKAADHSVKLTWEARRSEVYLAAEGDAGRRYVIGGTKGGKSVALGLVDGKNGEIEMADKDMTIFGESELPQAKRVAVANFKDMASAHRYEHSTRSAVAAGRSAVYDSGGFVVSTVPEVVVVNNSAAKGFVPVDRNPDNADVFMAGRAAIAMSKGAIVTQATYQTDVAPMIGYAANEKLRRKGDFALAALAPEGAEWESRALDGNRLLVKSGTTVNDVIRCIGIQGDLQAGIRSLEAPIAAKVGRNPEVSAVGLANVVKGKAQVAKRRTEEQQVDWAR